MEASEVKENVIKDILSINNLVGTSFLQYNGNTAKVSQSLDLTDTSRDMVYMQFTCILDATMLGKHILQPLQYSDFAWNSSIGM